LPCKGTIFISISKSRINYILRFPLVITTSPGNVSINTAGAS
jgi:hypothetical protein